jgi:hypothetical protein
MYGEYTPNSNLPAQKCEKVWKRVRQYPDERERRCSLELPKLVLEAPFAD